MARGPDKAELARKVRKVRAAARLKFPEAEVIGHVVQHASNGEAAVFATVDGETYVPWLAFPYRP